MCQCVTQRLQTLATKEGDVFSCLRHTSTYKSLFFPLCLAPPLCLWLFFCLVSFFRFFVLFVLCLALPLFYSVSFLPFALSPSPHFLTVSFSLFPLFSLSLSLNLSTVSFLSFIILVLSFFQEGRRKDRRATDRGPCSFLCESITSLPFSSSGSSSLSSSSLSLPLFSSLSYSL